MHHTDASAGTRGDRQAQVPPRAPRAPQGPLRDHEDLAEPPLLASPCTPLASPTLSQRLTTAEESLSRRLAACKAQLGSALGFVHGLPAALGELQNVQQAQAERLAKLTVQAHELHNQLDEKLPQQAQSLENDLSEHFLKQVNGLDEELGKRTRFLNEQLAKQDETLDGLNAKLQKLAAEVDTFEGHCVDLANSHEQLDRKLGEQAGYLSERIAQELALQASQQHEKFAQQANGLSETLETRLYKVGNDLGQEIARRADQLQSASEIVHAQAKDRLDRHRQYLELLNSQIQWIGIAVSMLSPDALSQVQRVLQELPREVDER